jgi:hypothetical protein
MGPSDVRDGMKVIDWNGQHLGRVTQRYGQTFRIEEARRLGRKRYVARYDRIGAIRDDAIHLTETGAQLEAEAYATPPIEREALVEQE